MVKRAKEAKMLRKMQNAVLGSGTKKGNLMTDEDILLIFIAMRHLLLEVRRCKDIILNEMAEAKETLRQLKGKTEYDA